MKNIYHELPSPITMLSNLHSKSLPSSHLSSTSSPHSLMQLSFAYRIIKAGKGLQDHQVWVLNSRIMPEVSSFHIHWPHHCGFINSPTLIGIFPAQLTLSWLSHLLAHHPNAPNTPHFFPFDTSTPEKSTRTPLPSLKSYRWAAAEAVTSAGIHEPLMTASLKAPCKEFG